MAQQSNVLRIHIVELPKSSVFCIWLVALCTVFGCSKTQHEIQTDNPELTLRWADDSLIPRITELETRQGDHVDSVVFTVTNVSDCELLIPVNASIVRYSSDSAMRFDPLATRYPIVDVMLRTNPQESMNSMSEFYPPIWDFCILYELIPRSSKKRISIPAIDVYRTTHSSKIPLYMKVAVSGILVDEQCSDVSLRLRTPNNDTCKSSSFVIREKNGPGFIAGYAASEIESATTGEQQHILGMIPRDSVVKRVRYSCLGVTAYGTAIIMPTSGK